MVRPCNNLRGTGLRGTGLRRIACNNLRGTGLHLRGTGLHTEIASDSCELLVSWSYLADAIVRRVRDQKPTVGRHHNPSRVVKIRFGR